MSDFSHIDQNNQPGMVDVSAKENTRRSATAQSIIDVGPELMALLEDGDIQSKKRPRFPHRHYRRNHGG